MKNRRSHCPAKHLRRHSARGFTLAEMAVVVLLVGIMLTMGIGVLNAQREQAAVGC